MDRPCEKGAKTVGRSKSFGIAFDETKYLGALPTVALLICWWKLREGVKWIPSSLMKVVRLKQCFVYEVIIEKKETAPRKGQDTAFVLRVNPRCSFIKNVKLRLRTRLKDYRYVLRKQYIENNQYNLQNKLN